MVVQRFQISMIISQIMKDIHMIKNQLTLLQVQLRAAWAGIKQLSLEFRPDLTANHQLPPLCQGNF